MAAGDAQVKVRQLPARVSVGEPGLRSPLREPFRGHDAALGFSTRDTSRGCSAGVEIPGTAHHPTSRPSPLRLWSGLPLEGSGGAPPPRPGKHGQRGAGREPGSLHALGAMKRPSARGPRGPAPARRRWEGGGSAPGSRAGYAQERSPRTRAREARAAGPLREGRGEGCANPGESLTWSRRESGPRRRRRRPLLRRRESS